MAALIRWRPGWYSPARYSFDELEQVRRQMDSLWDSVFGSQRAPRTAGVFPALNLYDDEEALHVTAEVPGMGPGDLEIAVEDNNLLIKGERRIAPEGDEASYHRREREMGVFQRIFPLPVAVDPEKIKAVCKDGVLTILLPKAPEAKPVQIQVTSA